MPPSADRRIFINYRRGDTNAYAGWLYDKLAANFGAANVFKDVDSLVGGADFPRVMSGTITKCDVLLALIGRNWFIGGESGRPRLLEPDDWVRTEIELALDYLVPVVPLLVEVDGLPRAEHLPHSLRRLLDRQALPLSHETFGANVAEIIRVVNDIGAVSEPSPALSTVRSHAATFATIEQLFRTRVQDELVRQQRFTVFGQATRHRGELDRLVTCLEDGEHVHDIALGRVFSTKRDTSLKNYYLDNVLSGVVALTQHRLLYVPAKESLPVSAVRYHHILNIDDKLGASILTLASHNVRLTVQPVTLHKEFAAYLRAQVAHR